MTGAQRTMSRLAFDGVLVLGIVAVLIMSAMARPAGQTIITPLDCSKACSPRAVLGGPAGTCNCAPDEAWVDKMNEKCGPVPYDLKVAMDGTFEYQCARPDKMRAWAKRGG